MKRLLYSLVVIVSTVLASCEPAEQGYTVEQYFDNIYTVNKSTVTPEFGDSVLVVSNLLEQGLEDGTRAHITLRYYFDYQTMTKPELKVFQVVSVIPTLPLTAIGSVDTTDYATPFSKLHQYEFIDRYVQPVWIWKNRLNINISYFGIKDNAEFVMSVVGVNEDCVELDLRAKAKRSGMVTTTKLLAFDLSNFADFLTDEQKASLKGKEKLRTRIYFDREEKGAVNKVNIIGGEFANPFK